MVEHTDLVLWQHNVRSKLSRVLTMANSIRRITKISSLKRRKQYSELIEVADSLEKLYDDLDAMICEMSIELKRLTKEKW